MLIKNILILLCLFISQNVFSEGLVFECNKQDLNKIEIELNQYFSDLGVQSDFFNKQTFENSLQFTLKNKVRDTSTLYLSWNPLYKIEDEILYLPSNNGIKEIKTVSKKEIVLALMQSGRQTIFSGKSCNVEAFEDHISVRQMIGAWAEHLHWKFPDGEKAEWNEAYWKDGMLKTDKPLVSAISDFFINQDKCSVGCYTATKIVIIQGILDYYQRIKNDPQRTDQITTILKSNGDVLVNIEPESMWQFLNNPQEVPKLHNGKLLAVKSGVEPLNFIPGDWVYFVNTDPTSSNKLGYEGSNSIYMGRAKFDDFYDDNGHHYFYHEKLKEIYNWRYGVFSRSRDYKNIRPVSSELLNSLGLPPHAGGLVLDSRSVPKYFGFE